MKFVSKDTKKVIEEIKLKTNNSPDIIYREIPIYDTIIYLIFNDALSDKKIIDHFILRFFNYEHMKRDNSKDKPKNIIEYLSKNIPTHKIVKTGDFDDLFYNLLSGFSIILVDGYDVALSLETRALLDSGVLTAQNEGNSVSKLDNFIIFIDNGLKNDISDVLITKTNHFQQK